MTAEWSMIPAPTRFAFVANRFFEQIMLESKGRVGQLFEEKPSRAGNTYSKVPANGDCSPAQGVCGDARLFGGGRIRAPALAQANFDRPGGDYLSAPVTSGDPAECALVCERDRRCRAWTFSYPTDLANGAVCWLKSNVPARVQSDCCVTGVRGAGVVERRNEAIETSIDRFGGDYKSFDLKSSDGGDDACKAACAADNKCRAWTYARPAMPARRRIAS
jgi:hypothetical protein